MIKAMRKNVKIVIWILIGAFAIGTILLFGMDSYIREANSTKSLAATVNDEEISLTQYYNVYNRYADFYKQFYKDNYAMAQNIFNIEEMSINQLIRDAIMVQKAKELGIIVRDEEIIEKIKTYPVFQTDGKFDPSKWNNVVKSYRMDWISIEENTRKDLYVDKLEKIVKNSVKVVDDEIYDFYVQKNEKIKLAYVLFEPSAFIEINSVKKYYEDHKAEFMQQRQYNARHILIKVDAKANEAEKKKSREKAEKIYKEIKEGANFLKLALENSDDTATKVKGGDLGFFPKGRMVKEFDEAILKLKEGEISSPVTTSFGYHIIKLESIKEEYVKPFNEVEKEASLRAVSDKEKELAKNKAKEFVLKAKSEDFEKVSKNFKVKFDTTAPFTRNSNIPGIGYEKDISSNAFKLKPNEISEPIEASKGIYVFKIISRSSVDKKKFDEEYSQLKESLVEQKRSKVLTNYYEQLKSKAKIKIFIEMKKKLKESFS